MALERLTQITEVGIQSGITLRNVNVEGAYVSGVVTATSLNITGGGANFVGVVTATSFNGNVTGNITPTGLVVSGVSTFQSSSFWGDGDVAYFGDGQDLLIFHNSTDSIIRDNGTGDLNIEGGNRIKLMNPTGIETYAVFNQDGASELWYDNAKKFETTGAGVSITGSVIASGISTFSSGVVVSAGSTSAPSISPSGDSNTGIFFPSADTIAIAEGGIEALRIDSSGNVGIGTTNPTTTLQVNGTTKVETSIGSTQSIWYTTLDSKNYSASNVDLLVQPETAYSFDASQIGSRFYEPTIFSHALTSANGSYTPTLYGFQNYTNVAGTASNARISGIGFWNQINRNSTTDISSSTSNTLRGFTNQILQSTNIGQSVVTGLVYGSSNIANIYKATATNIFTNSNQITVGNFVNSSASSTNAYGSYNIMQVGAASGTGIGTLTNYYGYYVAPTVALTGQLTNYYGLYLATPIVNGTLTNRYSIYSTDASSPMYHAGSIGIGTTNPSAVINVRSSAAELARFTNTGSNGGDWEVKLGGGGFEDRKFMLTDKFGGTDNVRVSVDSSGRVTMPYQPAFMVRGDVNGSIGENAKFAFTSTSLDSKVTFDRLGNWSDANDRFTAPVTGVYHFYFGIYRQSATSTTFSLAPRVNNSQLSTADTFIFFTSATGESGNTDDGMYGSFTLNLTANDYVELFMRGGAQTITVYSGHSFFGGHLIG